MVSTVVGRSRKGVAKRFETTAPALVVQRWARCAIRLLYETLIVSFVRCVARTIQNHTGITMPRTLGVGVPARLLARPAYQHMSQRTKLCGNKADLRHTEETKNNGCIEPTTDRQRNEMTE